MTLPYANAQSGDRALGEIQNILRGFGCSKFGSGFDFDTGELFVQFERKGQQVMLKASSKGYAAAWLKENPWSSRKRCDKVEWESQALEKGSVAVYSILRDWIKGQVTAIETGILTFEGAFLGHMMLKDGRRVLEVAQQMMLEGPKQ